MPAATRLLAAFLMLIGAFVLLVGVAVYSLVVGGQTMLAAVVSVAGVAGLAAGGLTYWLLRRDTADAGEGVPVDFEFDIEPEPLPVPAAAQPMAPMQAMARMPRRPLRVQAMPVAKLPPAYVDAVMRGAQARLTALKAQAGSADAR